MRRFRFTAEARCSATNTAASSSFSEYRNAAGTANVHYEDYTTYSPGEPTALKRQGTWANQLVKLKAQLDAEAKLSLAGSKYRNADEIKSRFKE